MSGSIGNSI